MREEFREVVIKTEEFREEGRRGQQSYRMKKIRRIGKREDLYKGAKQGNEEERKQVELSIIKSK